MGPLSTTIDSEALERLITLWNRTRCDGHHGSIAFASEDRQITIRVDGEVVVSPPTGSA